MAAGTSSGGVTKKLSTYTTAVMSYTIVDNPGSTTYTINSVKLTSSRSGGIPSTWSCSYWAGRSNASSTSGNAGSGSGVSAAYSAVFTERRNTAANAYPGQVSAIDNYLLAKGATTYTRTINYSFTVNKTHSAQSLPKFTLDFYFRGSNSNSSLYYWTEAISRTVPAKDRYTISYNINGGSGTTPANQTKWYGEALTLTTFVPTKAGYNFGGWKATNNTVYQKGGSYTANAATTLTAVWNPKPPSLTISNAYRIAATTSSSYSLDEEDEGTDCVVVADYMWSKALSDPTVTISSTMTDGSGTSKTVTFSEHASITGNDTADMYGGQIAFHSVAASLETDARYTGTITINDGTNPALTVSFTIQEAFFTVDWRDGGHGMGIGGPAIGDGLYVYSDPIVMHNTITNKVADNGSIMYIEAAQGKAALYVPKKADAMSNVVAALTLETAGGGAWFVYNHNDESLKLCYIGGADRTAGNNAPILPIVISTDGTVTHRGDINTTSVSGVFTAGSGITVAVFRFCQRGNVAAFYIGASKSTATAANTIIKVGTIAAGRRPPFECAGPGTSGVGDCWIDETGAVKFRSTSQIAANVRFYARVTYPVV